MDADAEENEKEKQKMSFMEFIKLYKIGKIPIIYFLVFYIVLYLINDILNHYGYKHYSYKMVLVATIPVTLIFSILTIKEVKITAIMGAILLLCVLYMIVCPD